MKKDGILNFVSECNITAAKAKEGEAPKLPTVHVEAYSGGIMDVEVWGLVVLDLAGMDVSDKTALLYGHADGSLDSVLGQTVKVNKGNTLSADGVIMGESEVVRQVVALSKNGFNFQASIGAKVKSYREVDEDEEVEVNGQTLKGPFTLATKSKLREISVLPLGADSTTEARIAAEQKKNETSKETKMEKEKNAAPSAEEIRAQAVEEQNRVMGIATECKDEYPEIKAQALKDGWNVEQAKSAVKDAKIKKLEAKIKADEEAAERPKAPAVTTGEKRISAKILEASAAMRLGMIKPEAHYNEETLEAANELRVHSITDLVRAALAISGRKLEHTRHETREFLQAAFSTRDIANILSNLANKFILQGYGTVEDSWNKIAAIRPVVDFKVNTGVRLIMSNLLREMGPGGEISHGELSDETRTVQADTKALMLGVTRKDLINDDLNALTDLPARLGFAAARTFNTDFWTVLNGAAAQFTGARGNTTTGALTMATMTAAELLFLALTDADGNPIGHEPTIMLTSPTFSAVARELYASTNLVAGGSARNVQTNIYAGKFEPVRSRYLTAAPWFLVSSPMAMPLMQTAFLNGRQQPYVESSDADFNTLGIQVRCYYDYGVSFGDYRAAVRSTGV